MWVVNAEGVYIENRPYHSYLEDDILTAINEKYGTNFSSLTYLREPTIAIGDDCPNWNAYEKIEMPSTFLWKMRLPGAEEFIFGKIENNILSSYAQTIEMALVVSESGSILSSFHLDNDFFTLIVKPKLNAIGISYTAIAYDTSTYSVEDNVANWDEYTLLQ